jgi:hypothetical protein
VDQSAEVFHIFHDRHHKTHQKVDQRQQEEKKIIKKIVSPEVLKIPVFTFAQPCFISKMFKTYLLISGRPFSDIENGFIQELLPDGESSQKVTECAMVAAVAIRAEITETLASALFARVSIDEWADHMGRRFLGETITALVTGELQTFTLALAPITSEHVTAEELYALLNIVKHPF